jgi:hypothetical protein
MKRAISREQINHLPSDLHRIVALALIDRGEWTLKPAGIVPEKDASTASCGRKQRIQVKKPQCRQH